MPADRSFLRTLDLDRSPHLFEGSLDLLGLVPRYPLNDVLWRALDQILRFLQPEACDPPDFWLPPLKSTVSFLRRTAGRSNGSHVSVFMSAVARRAIYEAVRPDNDCLCESRLSRHCRHSKLNAGA